MNAHPGRGKIDQKYTRELEAKTSKKRRQKMKGRLYIIGLALGLSALIISGCGTDAAQPTTGLANPASVYCEEQGYTLEMRTDADGGQYGVCIFPDGSECEEWAFYRGECKPASAGGAESTAAEAKNAETVAQPTPEPTATVKVEQPAATSPSDEPDSRDDGWLVYTNDVYGYRVSYPPSATITERGTQGFPSEELPEGVSVEDYMAQVREMYTDKLCVSIHSELGYVTIIAPPNANGEYGPCGRTGVGYEIVDKSETVVIGGESHLAEGLEEVGPGETLNYHNETLWIRLADGTVIEYGAAPDETATYEDYLETTRDVLLHILASFEQIPAANPPSMPAAGTTSRGEWKSYTNERFGYSLKFPGDATLLESLQGTGIQITGPLVDNERWPFLEVSHFDSDFYHPPTDTDVAQWVTQFVLAYDEIDTGVEIAGLPAVHLTTNATERSYGFDEYYVIKDSQLFRINILHAGGQQDWDLYNGFLQSFMFQRR